jgi:hypothetical protein
VITPSVAKAATERIRVLWVTGQGAATGMVAPSPVRFPAHAGKFGRMMPAAFQRILSYSITRIPALGSLEAGFNNLK